jgi:3-hydroxyisobutyrate dehydrogenase
VSGGTAAADAGTLAFMVGCDEADFPAVEAAIAPCRAPRSAPAITGRAGGKICNNMVLGISMIGVCEAFALARKLGLDGERFFDIASSPPASAGA